MPIIAEIIHAALPSPDMAFSGLTPRTYPAPGATEADIDTWGAYWQAPYPLVDNISSLGFEFTENGITAALYQAVNLGGGLWYAETKGASLYPETSYAVRMKATTANGYVSVWRWSFTTRSAMITSEQEGEIASGYRHSAGGIADIAMPYGGYNTTPASLFPFAGLLFSALGNLFAYAGTARAALGDLGLPVGGFTEELGDLTAAAPLGGIASPASLSVNALFAIADVANLFAMTLGNGAAEMAKARLTVKKDFEDLLAVISIGIGNEQIEEALRAEAITHAPSYPALRSEVIGGKSEAVAALIASKISIDRLYEALRSLGVGKEQAAAVLLAIESAGGDALLLEVDLLSEILGDTRQ